MYQRTLRHFSSRISGNQKKFTTSSTRQFTSSRTTMAQQTEASKIISETSKAEGGPEKGSLSSQMQSQIGKTQNFEQAASEITSKLKNAPESITSQDANYIKSREARATGQNQPPSDSLSAETQRVASMNEKGATETSSTSTSELSPEQQSANDRLENFEKVAEDVASKMARNPEDVTKEEGDLLHSREQRAFGETSKGGIASQAQKLAAENEKKGSS